MLCFEGISLMLNIFNGQKTIPNYRIAAPVSGEFETLTIHEDVGMLSRHDRLYLTPA